MAESLLNLGGAVQNMIGIAQLGQMRERTELIKQDREIDAQRAAEREKANRINAHLEIAKNPMFEGSPVAIQAMQAVGREYGLPIPDEEAYAGRKALRSFYETLGDPKASVEEKQKAFFSASTYSPTLLKQGLDNWDKFQNNDDRHRRLMLAMQQDELKIRALNNKQQAVELQQGLYATIGGVMSQMMDATKIKDADGKRDLGTTFQKIMSSKDERERTILRHSVKDLDSKMQERVLNLSSAFDQFYEAKNKELRPIVEAVHQTEAEGREVDESDLSKVKALELLDASKEAVEKWAAQPYDKQAWTRLQNTMRQVQQAAAGSKKELSNLDGIRTGMLENATRRTNLAVDKEEAKMMAGEHLAALQQRFAELPEDQQSGQVAAKLIKESGFKDVKVEDVLQANPLKFKATKEVQIKDRTFTPEQAGRVSAMNRAIAELDQASELLVKPDGSIDRATLFSANTFGGLPFSKGRDVNRYIEDAVEAKLRLETGAAANRDEIKRIAARFKPSLKDADTTITGKLSQLRSFMQDSFNIIDPTGEVRGRIGGQAAGKPPSSPRTRFEQLKSQHPDWDQKRIYDQMIQEGY